MKPIKGWSRELTWFSLFLILMMGYAYFRTKGWYENFHRERALVK